MLIRTLLSTVMQLGVVLLLAYAVYGLATRKRRTGFLAYIGLVACPWRAVAFGALVGLVFTALILAVPALRAMASSSGSVAGEVVASGASTVLIIAALVVAALFKTSLAEEILFRGLIGKRMIKWTGFAIGNTVQAVLFGLVHLLLLAIPGVSKRLVLLMVVTTGVLGWVSGWLNERFGKGSILPGWAAHGTANVLSYLSVLVVHAA